MADAVTEGVRREARRWFELPVSSPTCSHVISSPPLKEWPFTSPTCIPEGVNNSSIALQASTKQQIALGPQTAYRGYQQLGANVTRYDGGFQRDWHEAIDLYKEETDMVRPIASAAQNFSPAALEPCRRLHGRLHYVTSVMSRSARALCSYRRTDSVCEVLFFVGTVGRSC